MLILIAWCILTYLCWPLGLIVAVWALLASLPEY